MFNPDTVDTSIHIIGCGAIGSHLAELLARLGVDNIHLYDFDTVEAKNIANQMFFHKHINKLKVLATAEIIQMINPNAKVEVHPEGYIGQRLRGYVFLAVDDIELRLQICKDQEYNSYIKAVFDFRMRLTDAQHYAADWRDRKQVLNLMKTMDFTHAEAEQATPINACGSTLSIIPTVKIITSTGIANWINFVKTDKLYQTILIDAFEHSILPM